MYNTKKYIKYFEISYKDEKEIENIIKKELSL